MIKVMEQFLTLSQINRLRIAEYVFSNKIVKMQQILANFEISKRSIANQVRILNNELFILDLKNVPLIINKDTLIFNSDINEKEWQTAIDKLTRDYFKQSIVFQVTKYLLENRSVNMIQMTVDLNVSQSYLYKIIGKVDYMIECSKLNFKIKKKSATYELSGKENQIRFVLYYFYLLTEQFSDIVTGKIFKMSVLKKVKDMRNEIQKNEINLSQESWIVAGVLFSENKKSEINREVLELHNVPFYILSLFYNPEIYQVNIYKIIWEHVFKYSKNNTLKDNIIEVIDMNTNKNFKDKSLLAGEILVRYIVYKELEFVKIGKLENNLNISNKDQAKISRTINDVFLTSFSDKRELELFSFHISEIMNSIIKQPKAITIVITIMRKASNRIVLVNLLTNIFDKNICIVDEEDKGNIDIIISDFLLENTTNSVKYFYLSNMNDLELLSSITNYISRLIVLNTINLY